MRIPLLTLAALALAWPVQAHDFWLQPLRFRLPAPGIAPTSVQIGHGDSREAWAVKADRVVMLRGVGPDGATDLRASVRAGPGPQLLPLRAPGVHVIALETSPIPSVLPALRFNDYLREEGLTPALQARQRTGRMKATGRELYSRRAKTLVQVGTTTDPQPHVTRPMGLTLEIVPEIDPYALAPGRGLPVRVLYQGRALPGALVKLTDLGRDEKPVEVHRTDRAGRAVFHPRRDGEWLLNVVWTRPLAGDPNAEFETTFSSLTFGYPGVSR